MVKKKVYIPIGLCLVLLVIGFLFLRSDVPDEPIVIYKTTTPLPKKTDTLRDQTSPTRLNDMPPESRPLRGESPSEETQRHMNLMDSPESLEGRDTLLVEPEIQSQSELLPNVVDFKTTPQGFPLTPYWDYPENEQNDWSYEQKLLDHVLVKLWREGTRNFVGGSIELDTQRVRAHYRNTLYVQWEDVEHPNGSMVKIITRALGAGDVNWQQKGPFDLPPPGVHLIDIQSTEGKGIDPFTFLTSEELPK